MSRFKLYRSDDVIFVNAAYGLGENVVQGSIAPDGFYVHKPTLKKGHKAVLKRKLGDKALTMVFSDPKQDIKSTTGFTKNIKTPKRQQTQFAISDEDVVTLAQYALKIEEHYSKEAGYQKPMDIEWAKDGLDGQLYIVQARPETVESRKEANTLELYTLKERSEVRIKGNAVGTKIGSGKIRKIEDIDRLGEFQPGDVLVAETTSPDWEPVMKIASAIITNTGGRTCHAAIVSRELGIPAVVGASDATNVLQESEEVIVSCAEGETGFVYSGLLDFEVTTTNLSEIL